MTKHMYMFIYVLYIFVWVWEFSETNNAIEWKCVCRSIDFDIEKAFSMGASFDTSPFT